MNIVIGVLTFVLVLVSLFLCLVILAQKAKSDGGVGAAMGGGMAEAAFGADTGNVLSRSTIYASIAFFILSFALFLAHVRAANGGGGGGALPSIAAPASTTPSLPPLAPMTPGATAPAAGTGPSLAIPAPGSATTAPATGTPAAPAPEAPKAP